MNEPYKDFCLCDHEVANNIPLGRECITLCPAKARPIMEKIREQNKINKKIKDDEVWENTWEEFKKTKEFKFPLELVGEYIIWLRENYTLTKNK